MTGARDADYLHQAIELAAEHSRSGRCGPFGALIVRDAAIIGQGWNQVISGCDPTAHAEIVAIRDACRRLASPRLTGATIYATCEPCPMCLAAIYWAGIARICFAATRDDAARCGFDDALLYAEVAQPLAARRIPCVQLHHAAGVALLEAWQRNPDRVMY